MTSRPSDQRGLDLRGRESSQTIPLWIKLLFSGWVVLLVPTYGLSETRAQTWMPPSVWLAFVMVIWPATVYMPCHFVFQRLFPRRSKDLNHENAVAG